MLNRKGRNQQGYHWGGVVFWGGGVGFGVDWLDKCPWKQTAVWVKKKRRDTGNPTVAKVVSGKERGCSRVEKVKRPSDLGTSKLEGGRGISKRDPVEAQQGGSLAAHIEENGDRSRNHVMTQAEGLRPISRWKGDEHISGQVSDEGGWWLI